MGELLNMRQENVSRLERRADLLVSTLQSYIAAMGGELSLVVEFKDRPPVKISGLISSIPYETAKQNEATGHSDKGQDK
jgi:hypothetical protein